MSTTDSASDIRLKLQSDKITVRAKARKACLDLIKSDVAGDLFVSSSDWKGIVEAAAKGAQIEIKNSIDKEKPFDLETATLMKSLVKHVVHSITLIPVATYQSILESSLDILYDKRFSIPYKDEYKNILCEILEPKISSSLSLSDFSLLFLYMREVAFLSQGNSTEILNRRLLKSFCRALCMDSCQCPNFFETILLWFIDCLLPSVGDDPQSLASMTATIADCCILMLQYRGINCANVFFAHSKVLLAAVVKQLSISQLRDTHRESCLRFILESIKFSTTLNLDSRDGSTDLQLRFTSRTVYAPLSKLDPFCGSLRFLCDALTSDNVLRSLVTYAFNQVRQSQVRESYVNAVNDVKVRCNLHITALAVVLHQEQHARNMYGSEGPRSLPSETQRDENVQNTQNSQNNQGQNNSQNLKRSRSILENNENVSSGNLLSQGTSSSCTMGYADIILQRIENFEVQSSSSAQQNFIGNQTNTARHIALASLDGLMILLAAISDFFPSGDFLVSKHGGTNEKFQKNSTVTRNKKKCNVCEFENMAEKLLQWIAAVRLKLFEVLPLSGEQQIQGSIFLALKGLVVVTSSLLKDRKHTDTVSNNCAQKNSEKFCEIWTGIVLVILSDGNLVRYFKSNRTHSVSVCVYTFLTTLLHHDLISLHSRSYVLNAVLNFPGVKNPAGVECPALFHLLSTTISKSEIGCLESVCSGLLSESQDLQNSADFRSIEYFRGRTKLVADSTHTVPSTAQTQCLNEPLHYSLQKKYAGQKIKTVDGTYVRTNFGPLNDKHQF
jgi:hypothetical protein